MKRAQKAVVAEPKMSRPRYIELKAMLDDLWRPFIAITVKNRDMGASRPAVRDMRCHGLMDRQTSRSRQSRDR